MFVELWFFNALLWPKREGTTGDFLLFHSVVDFVLQITYSTLDFNLDL